MADSLVIQGNVVKTQPPNMPEGVYNSVTFNNRLDTRVAQALPPLTELVRLGNVWTMRTANASAFDFVAAMPTTLATAILYNGEPAGGKSYVILSMFLTTIVSTAAAGQLGLLAQLLPNAGGSATAPTHSAPTTLLNSNCGRLGYPGNARRAINVTTAFTDYWSVVGQSGGHAAANKGASVYADIAGGLIVPPGGALGMNAIAGTVATGAGIVGCTWAEVQLDMNL